MSLNKIDSEKFALLRLKCILQKYGFENLMEYTLDSQIGCRLDLLYKEILEEFLDTTVNVSGEEISDGKYRLKFIVKGYSYIMISKASFSNGDIAESLMDFVIKPVYTAILSYAD